MTRFVVPSSVHTAADREGNLVLLNEQTGQWHKLNRTGNELYSALCDNGVEAAVEVFASQYPQVPQEEIRRHAERCLSDLVERGLLEPEIAERGSGGVPIATAPRSSVSLKPRLVAAAALPLALLLLKLPFWVSVKTVKLLKRRLTKRAATKAEAFTALAAAKRVSRFYPGRVACLELSLMAALTVAFLGASVDWCLGVAVDPQSFHAWIEAEGQPVTDPFDDPIPPTYQRVLAV